MTYCAINDSMLYYVKHNIVQCLYLFQQNTPVDWYVLNSEISQANKAELI